MGAWSCEGQPGGALLPQAPRRCEVAAPGLTDQAREQAAGPLTWWNCCIPNRPGGTTRSVSRPFSSRAVVTAVPGSPGSLDALVEAYFEVQDIETKDRLLAEACAVLDRLSKPERDLFEWDDPRNTRD